MLNSNPSIDKVCIHPNGRCFLPDVWSINVVSSFGRFFFKSPSYKTKRLCLPKTGLLACIRKFTLDANAMKKNSLFRVDSGMTQTTQLCWHYFINHEIWIPSLNNQDDSWKVSGRFFLRWLTWAVTAPLVFFAQVFCSRNWEGFVSYAPAGLVNP